MNDYLNVKIIKDYIKNNGLTVKEFCKQCGVSVSTYYNIINGKNFDLRLLLRIAKRINVPFKYLFAKI